MDSVVWGHESKIIGILRREILGVLGGFDQSYRTRRQLPDGADDFRVMGMPDQQNRGRV